VCTSTFTYRICNHTCTSHVHQSSAYITMPTSQLKLVVTNTNQTWQQPQHFDTISALAVLPPGATSCAPQLETPSLHASALISDPLALNSIFGSSKQHGVLHTIMHDIPSELQGKEAMQEIHSLSKNTSPRTQSATVERHQGDKGGRAGRGSGGGGSGGSGGGGRGRSIHGGRASSLPNDDTALTSQKIAQSSMFVAVYQPNDAFLREKLWCI
jgi:uncharacterized membrane protein YgcG